MERTTYTTYTTPAQPAGATVITQHTSSPAAGRATSNVTVVHQSSPVVQHHVSSL